MGTHRSLQHRAAPDKALTDRREASDIAEVLTPAAAGARSARDCHAQRRNRDVTHTSWGAVKRTRACCTPSIFPAAARSLLERNAHSLAGACAPNVSLLTSLAEPLLLSPP